jgi:serine-type D-Ala-D-Ala carboxypeptidase (penicillin-binding protein 5/6)
LAQTFWRGESSRSNGTRLLTLSLAVGALAPVIAQAQQPLASVPNPTLQLAAQGEPSEPPLDDPGLPPLTSPVVKAASAMVMDVATGQVLWEKNGRIRRPMASTTKIMTATLVIESGLMDDTVTFSEHARKTPYANLNAKPGEQFRMKDLLYAIMMRSSNDACVAVAEHLNGAAWKFSAAMTAKAREIGAVDTNFVTTNGLYHPNHYSTAYDLGLMARYAMQYPMFNEVVATRSKTISRSINWKDTLVRNHNKFLEKYFGADGVKTGYVRQAGKCLVASSTRAEAGNPWRIVTVVLNSPDTYGDSQRMQDWARKYFQPVFFSAKGEQIGAASIVNGSARQVSLLAADDLRAVVRRDLGNTAQREIRTRQQLSAPIARSQVAGQLIALVGGREVARVDLVAERSVAQTWTAAGAAPLTGGSLALAFFLMGPRYVRALANGTRRKRRRP